MERDAHPLYLSDAANGKRLRICRVDAGMQAKRRLANLGLVPGVVVRKKQAAPMHGPVVIEVRGSILAIGRGIASKIVVVDEVE
ncbi:MAG: ferrous iron transport protein A [Candidatus Lokiarchaeota archaeon]|nr:ferrous iron transport protein A [Candidatus Lokiarchaeota archaeon]